MNNRQIAMKRILNSLKGQAEYVKESKAYTEQEKIEQLDLILEVIVQLSDKYKPLEKFYKEKE